MYASLSSDVICCGWTPSRAIQASIKALPKSSGSASANNPGRRRYVASGRLGYTKGPPAADANGMVSGASSMPDR